MAVRDDLIIRDAVVFDGTAAARFTGDVGVAGDRIVAVGDLGGATADSEIDAAGMMTARFSAALNACSARRPGVCRP